MIRPRLHAAWSRWPGQPSGTRPRRLPGRRELAYWAGVGAVAALLGVALAAVLAAVTAALIWATSLHYVIGVLTGIAAAVLWCRAWARTRQAHLRELVDWYGEELEARRIADRQTEARIHAARERMP